MLGKFGRAANDLAEGDAGIDGRGVLRKRIAKNKITKKMQADWRRFSCMIDCMVQCAYLLVTRARARCVCVTQAGSILLRRLRVGAG